MKAYDPELIQFILALLLKRGHNRLCRTSLNPQHTKEASSHFQKFKQAASAFAQSAVKIYFHISVKILLSKMLGGTGDKVILLISLFCLFSYLASVSDVCVLGKTDGVV